MISPSYDVYSSLVLAWFVCDIQYDLCKIFLVKSDSAWKDALFVEKGGYASHIPVRFPKSKPPKRGDRIPLKIGLTVGSAVRSEGEGGEMQATLFSPASKSNLNEIR